MPIRLRLFPRFLIYLLLLTVIPVALIGYLVVDINKESLQFEVQRYHLQLALLHLLSDDRRYLRC